MFPFIFCIFDFDESVHTVYARKYHEQSSILLVSVQSMLIKQISWIFYAEFSRFLCISTVKGVK